MTLDPRFAAIIALLPLGVALAAAPDNNVEWSGVSHLGASDRSPRVPLRDEAFTVRFQTFASDLTSARVRQFVTGTPTRLFDATVVGQRGPYDLWEATVDARDAAIVEYDIELIDGTDSDFLGAGGVGDIAPAGGPFELNFTTLSHAPLGSTPVTTGVVFKVYAPTAPTAYVRGAFNGWNLTDPMTKVGDYFVAHIPSASAGAQYKYYFNATSTWKPDAFARRISTNGDDNTYVVDTDFYQWVSGPFTPPPFEEMVAYQLHVGTFAGRNDPLGGATSPSRFFHVTPRIGHLVELGVNTVYLNPVIEWPGSNSGGYNPINLTTIEAALGTPDQFKAMIDAFHQNGIAVVLDLVYNHFDGGSNYMYYYTGGNAANNPYFDTPPADTPWGPQLDMDQPEIRQFLLDAAVSLIEEYRLDGYRFDAVSAYTSGPQPGSATQFLRDFIDVVDTRYADKLMVAEIYGDDPWFSRPASSGGLGMDAQYHQNFRDAVRNATFDAALGDPNVGAVASAATRNDELKTTRCFNYIELHDEAWPLNGGQRMVRSIDTTFPHDDAFAKGRSKLAHGMTILARGIPAILMGTEWLEDDGWEFNKIDWSHKTAYAGVFGFFSDLISLRTSRPELFARSLARTTHLNESDNIFVIERVIGSAGSYLVVANFSNVDRTGYRIGLSRAGEWGVLVNSEASIYDGSGFGTAGSFQSEAVSADIFGQSALLNIPAHGIMLLQHDPQFIGEVPCLCERTGDSPASIDVQDLLDYLASWFPGDANADLNDDGATDVQDLLDFLSCWFGPADCS